MPVFPLLPPLRPNRKQTYHNCTNSFFYQNQNFLLLPICFHKVEINDCRCKSHK